MFWLWQVSEEVKPLILSLTDSDFLLALLLTQLLKFFSHSYVVLFLVHTSVIEHTHTGCKARWLMVNRLNLWIRQKCTEIL